jgi:nitrogen fixation-related uncharacterized protein
MMDSDRALYIAGAVGLAIAVAALAFLWWSVAAGSGSA